MLTSRVARTLLCLAAGAIVALSMRALAVLVGAVTLSPFQLTCGALVVSWLVVIAFAVGYGTGHERAVEQIKQQARENNVDWRWLSQPPPSEAGE